MILFIFIVIIKLTKRGLYMKKRSFVLVFCFSLILGLSGCDKGKKYVQPNASDECLHDYKFEKYNDNKHRKVCSKCGFSDVF